MRTLFFLLLLANVGFYAFEQYGLARTGDSPAPLLNPEKIKILKNLPPVPQKAAALPETQAMKPDACLEWGSFAGSELVRAEMELAPLQLGDKLTQRTTGEASSFWVYIPPLRTRADADKKVSELKSLGIQEYFLVQDAGPWQYAISLGVFKSDAAASAHLKGLQEKGVRSAVAGPRSNQPEQVLFVVREPGDAVAAKLVELRQRFPGSELKALACPGPV